jgi:hypothetical protein
MERAMGIEPTSAAWEAAILPLNHARSSLTYQTRLDSGKPVISSISRLTQNHVFVRSQRLATGGLLPSKPLRPRTRARANAFSDRSGI